MISDDKYIDAVVSSPIFIGDEQTFRECLNQKILNLTNFDFTEVVNELQRIKYISPISRLEENTIKISDDILDDYASRILFLLGAFSLNIAIYYKKLLVDEILKIFNVNSVILNGKIICDHNEITIDFFDDIFNTGIRTTYPIYSMINAYRIKSLLENI